MICRLSEVQPLGHTLKHATSLEDEAESQTLPLHIHKYKYPYTCVNTKNTCTYTYTCVHGHADAHGLLANLYLEIIIFKIILKPVLK